MIVKSSKTILKEHHEKQLNICEQLIAVESDRLNGVPDIPASDILSDGRAMLQVLSIDANHTAHYQNIKMALNNRKNGVEFLSSKQSLENMKRAIAVELSRDK